MTTVPQMTEAEWLAMADEVDEEWDKEERKRKARENIRLLGQLKYQRRMSRLVAALYGGSKDDE